MVYLNPNQLKNKPISITHISKNLSITSFTYALLIPIFSNIIICRDNTNIIVVLGKYKYSSTDITAAVYVKAMPASHQQD